MGFRSELHHTWRVTATSVLHVEATDSPTSALQNELLTNRKGERAEGLRARIVSIGACVALKAEIETGVKDSEVQSTVRLAWAK